MKKLKIIMIDAFKPEYLKYAPFLSSLTKKCQWGELEMPAGHGGGMEIFFKGKSDALATFYKKQNSSLRWTKHFTWLEAFKELGRIKIDFMINFPRLIRNKELHRTGKIPLKQLYKMEMHDSKEDYKNLNVTYRYFPELDKKGHKYGTESKEIEREIRKLDRKISKMKFDILLSDHGMADIKKTISVPETKDCLIESDMARYWGEKPDFSSREGRWIKWQNKSYGDYIFLANRGVLILPNYWQRNKKVKAMHGYNGKDKEMKAFYLIKKEGKRKDLKVEELHKILEEMLKRNEGNKIQ